jgi:hypothetical protein
VTVVETEITRQASEGGSGAEEGRHQDGKDYEGRSTTAVFTTASGFAGRLSLVQRLADLRQRNCTTLKGVPTNDFIEQAIPHVIPLSLARSSVACQSRANALYASLVKHDTYLCPTLVTQHWVAYGDDLARAHDPRERFISPSTLVYWQPSMNMLTEYRTPAYIAYTKRNYTVHLGQVSKEQAAGVQLLAGTDLSVPYTCPGSSVHDEMKLFVTAGLTPLQALQAAITHPVHYFGLEQSMGSVTKGKLAELVLLEENPMLEIGNTERIAAVITHGRLLQKQDLDALMLQGEHAAHAAK